METLYGVETGPPNMEGWGGLPPFRNYKGPGKFLVLWLVKGLAKELDTRPKCREIPDLPLKIENLPLKQKMLSFEFHDHFPPNMWEIPKHIFLKKKCNIAQTGGKMGIFFTSRDAESEYFFPFLELAKESRHLFPKSGGSTLTPPPPSQHQRASHISLLPHLVAYSTPGGARTS